MGSLIAQAVSRFTVGSIQPLHSLFQEITPGALEGRVGDWIAAGEARRS